MTLELLGKSWALWLLGSWLRTLPLLLVLQVVDRLLAGARRHELRAVGWWALLVAALAPTPLPGAPTLYDLAPGAAAAIPAEDFSAAASTLLPPFWLGVALAALTLQLRRHQALIRRWEQGRDAGVERTVALRVAALCGELSLPRLPEVVISDAVGGPALCGWRRPRIYLPLEWVTSASPESLEHVLLHELFHLRHRDPWLWAFCGGLSRLLWPQPMVAWAVRRILALREIESDQAVVGRLQGNAAAYRRTLLEMVRGQYALEVPTGPAFGAHPAGIITRLRLLQVGSPMPRGSARRSRLLLQATLLALYLGLSGFLSPVLVAAERWADVDPSTLQGCLRLRYYVLGKMADAEGH